MDDRSTRVYVLDIDGRPVIAFPAVSGTDARQLTKEVWLKEDLLELKSDGSPLWSLGCAMSIRLASGEENAAFQTGEKQAAAEADELKLVYLVDVDE